MKWLALATNLKFEIDVLIALFRHVALPRSARILVIFLLSYIFSPIDLIPDFIPIIGHIDDFLLIPIIMLLVKRVTPASLLEEVRKSVKENPKLGLFKSKWTIVATTAVILIWFGLSYLILDHLDWKAWLLE